MADPHEAAREARRKKDEEHRVAVEKANAQRGADAIKQQAMLDAARPTPTQRENDLAARGVSILEHEPDNGPPDVTTMQRVEPAPKAKGEPQRHPNEPTRTPPEPAKR